MTSQIRILLAQIATFEQQHKAGLTPPCSALAEFFDTARLARLEVEAFDHVEALDREVPRPRPPFGPQDPARDRVAPAEGANAFANNRGPNAIFEKVNGVGLEKIVFELPLAHVARAVFDHIKRDLRDADARTPCFTR